MSKSIKVGRIQKSPKAVAVVTPTILKQVKKMKVGEFFEVARPRLGGVVGDKDEAFARRAQHVERFRDALDDGVAPPDDAIAVEDEGVDLGDEGGPVFHGGAAHCGEGNRSVFGEGSEEGVGGREVGRA